MKPLLAVNGLSVHFAGLKAVEDVSFEVTSGSIVGLIGPNGAGKTTLLNRSEEHTSDLQSLMRISSAVFRLKKKKPIHLRYPHDAFSSPAFHLYYFQPRRNR